MERIDLHTHSTFSHDGNAALADMVAAAHLRGLKYYGVSEHFDYDCAALGVTVNEKPLRRRILPRRAVCKNKIQAFSSAANSVTQTMRTHSPPMRKRSRATSPIS